MDGHEKAVFETGDQALKAANLSGVSRCFRSRSTVPSENEARRSSRLRPTEGILMHQISAIIVAALVLSVAISVTPALVQSTSQKSGFSMSECVATCQKSSVDQSCKQYCQRMSRTIQ